MSKKLVAYFSISGVTARAAKEIAAVENADCFEIKPEAPYTREDLDWNNKQSRSSLEMNDLNCRPAICGCVENMADYDVVFVGFPIWWGREPSAVDTVRTAYDFSGKRSVPSAPPAAATSARPPSASGAWWAIRRAWIPASAWAAKCPRRI